MSFLKRITELIPETKLQTQNPPTLPPLTYTRMVLMVIFYYKPQNSNEHNKRARAPHSHEPNIEDVPRCGAQN
jgi:hypothetical protein